MNSDIPGSDPTPQFIDEYSPELSLRLQHSEEVNEFLDEAFRDRDHMTRSELKDLILTKESDMFVGVSVEYFT